MMNFKTKEKELIDLTDLIEIDLKEKIELNELMPEEPNGPQ